jgi:4-azaleucine resistance transporter AzlC
VSARTDLVAGVRAISPILLGVVPFALVAGITAVDAGITPTQAVGMSVIVFAGAAQLAAIELIGKSAPAAVVVLTAIVINLRFVMYSASIAPYFRRFDTVSKWLGAYVLTDQAYAVSLAEYREKPPEERSRKWFYFGAAVTLWVVWIIGTATGALVGATVPEGLSLEFAVPLTFMALLFHAIDDRPTVVAAVVGAGVAIVAAVLPFNLGLVTAGLVGIVAGVLVEMRAGAFPTVPETDGGTDDGTVSEDAGALGDDEATATSSGGER